MPLCYKMCTTYMPFQISEAHIQCLYLAASGRPVCWRIWNRQTLWYPVQSRIFFIQRECYAGPTCKWVWIVTGVCWSCVSPLLGAPLGLSCHTRVCSVTSRWLEECHHEWLSTSVQSLWGHNPNVFWEDRMSYATKQSMFMMPRTTPQLNWYKVVTNIIKPW